MVKDLDGEIWKEVVTAKVIFKGQYMVSNLGRVKSLDRKTSYINKKGKLVYQYHKGVLINPGRNKMGYEYVTLRKKSKGFTFRVHRLVINAFVRDIKKGEHIHHKNSISYDNRLENLEILTHRANLSKERSIKSGLPTGVRASKYKGYISTIKMKTNRDIDLYLGRYDNISQCKKAYDLAVKLLEKNNLCPVETVILAIDEYRESIGFEKIKRKRAY